MEPSTPAPPRPLDYDRPPVAAPVSAVRFGGAASLLLLVNTLLGGAMALSIVYVDRLGLAAWLMVAAGVLTVFTVLGRLSIERPRFGQALALAALASAAAGAALALNLSAARTLERELVGNRVGPVVVYIETGRGALLATLRLAWQLCVASTAAAILLALYVGFCLIRVARARRAAGLADGG